MNRRDFISMAAAFLPPPLRAATMPCWSQMPTLPGTPIASFSDQTPAPKPFQFPVNPPVAKRPLWSKMSAAEKTRVTSQLQAAYGKMAQRTDRTGLLYQALLHQRYCDH